LRVSNPSVFKVIVNILFIKHLIKKFTFIQNK